MADPGQGVLHRRCLRHRREQGEVVQLGQEETVYAPPAGADSAQWVALS